MWLTASFCWTRLLSRGLITGLVLGTCFSGHRASPFLMVKAQKALEPGALSHFFPSPDVQAWKLRHSEEKGLWCSRENPATPLPHPQLGLANPLCLGTACPAPASTPPAPLCSALRRAGRTLLGETLASLFMSLAEGCSLLSLQR